MKTSQMIDGNRLVEALSLPSHDKQVLELLKDLGLKRPMKDENYNGVSITMEDPSSEEKFEIYFDEDSETEKQKKGAYGNVDFYLNGIIIFPSELISPPFGIEWSDSYEEVKSILGRKADFTNRYKHKIWLLEDNEKKYLLNMKFTTDGKEIKKWGISSYNNDRQYTMLINKD